ncbi:MAG: UDP-4-amino-4,6-dideoxy-N-acetyl-beta-L-altrosamine transaminase [Clostridia bacterium]|nr:UDP-4-amino-4,6-dideoxy-N-acetyl-beta-L-altrosamine transaminase [Clostridia bacterium]
MRGLPAICGGEPVRQEFLPYARQSVDESDIAAVVEVLCSPFLTTGPKIQEFEQKFADYVGAKYAVAVATGTAALHAAVFAAGINPRDEVITTPMTFAASANCVLYQGGRVVFADIDPQTYNIDPEDIARKITERTKAIIPVDYTGQPARLDVIKKIAAEFNLPVIEDAAHALGAAYQGQKVGSISDLTTFSFHPVKHITTGEGGMVTTNDPGLYERLLLFRNHGITRDKRLLMEDHGLWYYEQQALGYNYRITDFQAALGISQLAKSEMFLAVRRRYAGIYNEAFKDLPGVIVPWQAEDARSSWHLYVLQLELEKLKAGRKEIFEAMLAENIGVNVHYIPVYLHPYYQSHGYRPGLCPEAEKLYERMLTLPLFPGMTEGDVRDVIEAVSKVVTYFSI